MKKKIIVLAGPAGTGKNSIINGVLHKVKKSSDLVTSTTRSPRVHEVNGVDYFFVDNKTFEENLKNLGKLIIKDLKLITVNNGMLLIKNK